MIYTLLKSILWLLFKIGLRLNVEGTENIPKKDRWLLPAII